VLLDINLMVMRAYTSGAWDGAKEDKAIRHLEAAAALMANDPDTVDKGLINQRAGHFYLHRGEPRKTLEWANRAQDIFTRLGVPIGTSLGTALTYTGRVDEGIAYNERNWEPVVNGGNNLIISVLGHELVTTHALLRNVPRARACAGRALAVLPGDYSAGVGMARRPLVLALALAGEVTEAEPLSEAVWQLERGTFYGCIFEDGLAVAFHHRRRGDMQRAQEYIDWVTPVFRERNLGAALSGCSFVSGCLAFEAGRFDEAVAELSASLEVCRRGGNVLFELWVLPVLAETYLRSGRLEKAAECVTRGFDLLTSGQDWRGLSARPSISFEECSPARNGAGMRPSDPSRWLSPSTAGTSCSGTRGRHFSNGARSTTRGPTERIASARASDSARRSRYSSSSAPRERSRRLVRPWVPVRR
jgi:tetratricopeptide (TPR) repeat protein